MNVKTKFSPPPWLRNPHLQTICASKLSNRAKIEFEPERLELSDGDFIDLAKSKQQSERLVLIFHGLGGSIQSPYAQGAFATLENNDFRPILMHWRGCSGTPNRLERAYHSGSSDDIKYVIDFITARHPNASIVALGYSLGANALLKYLGEQKQHSPLAGALAVCPPLVLSEGAKKLDTGISKIYQRYLISELSKQYKLKQDTHPELQMTTLTKQIKKNFWNWDDAITAPANGFKDVHDYYEQCASRQFLNSITVPTKILYARDDPFFTEHVIPERSELSQAVELDVQDCGGHVGFMFDRNTPRNEYWLDRWVLDNIRQIDNTH